MDPGPRLSLLRVGFCTRDDAHTEEILDVDACASLTYRTGIRPSAVRLVSAPDLLGW